MKPLKKLKVSKEEEEYIVSKLTYRILDFWTLLAGVKYFIQSVGGINKIVNRSSENTYEINLKTTMSGGDFQQLLQEYRRLDANKEKTI